MDIDTLRMKEVKELNIRAIPVAVLGDKWFVGSKQETIDELLEAWNDQNNDPNQ